ncbi:ABC transporter substrate-binding protein [Micromonospora echinofusca]|uniref:ABC transporter substrate-binding protein n=1 Tax=Micromonospora echinofusca TaxID=47858 RepID=UPI000C6FD9DF|nr:ABC transporter substrate-binding protein [Micromonospora sp. MSM11]MCL7459620.1 ABC transporter substrate-binding protein [Micromonospora sp. MSM11]
MSRHVLRAGTRRVRLLAAASLLAAAALTGCSGAATDGASNADAQTLTLAISAPPNLDPYKANIDLNNIPTVALAYAPLIRMNADRTFTGELAESFGYVDQQNKTFQMKLRPGLTFADGTPLDAKAVVASLEYMRKVSPKAKTWAGTITSITAPDASTVVVTNKAPNPSMRQIFSQAVLSGSIISPAGLADPDQLAQRTFGAGPYVLDAAETVPNDHYTYVANPRYWNKADQHWKKVVVRIIPDSNSTVQAIQSGQVDYAALNADAGPAVKAAGLRHVTASVALVGVVLADRNGTVAPALKDVRVRQALNHAIDRATITKTIFGDFAHPTSQTAAPGFDGYQPALDDRYPYDPAKAKQLLTEAGYPNGFTLKVEAHTPGIGVVTQAVIGQWKKIGVNVELTTDTQVQQWLENVLSRKFPVVGFGYGNLPTYLSSLDFMRPVPNPFNPFATADAELARLLDQAIAEPDQGKQSALFKQAVARTTELAWFAPVVRMDGIGVMGPRTAGVQTTADNGLPSVVTLRPAS